MPILDKDDKEQVKKYNEFIKKCSKVSFMQSVEWGKVKSNWIQEIVYIEEKGNIVAGMNLLIKKIPKLKTSIIYAPRGPVCDINNVKLVEKLVDEVKPIMKKYNAFVLKMDPQVEFDKDLNEKYKKLGYSISKNTSENIQPIYNMVLDITDKTKEQILKEFSEKTRYNVRLAERKGIKVRYSRDEKDLEIFYCLYKITTIRDRISCRPYDYFLKMLNSYSEENLRIYIAEYEGQALAGAIAINFGNEIFYVYGASSNEKRNFMPNYAMQMSMIEWGIETKCKSYNFGGLLNPNNTNGLYRFKVGFCRESGVKTYMGEINKVYKKSIYFAYSKGVPLIRKIGKMINNFNTQ